MAKTIKETRIKIGLIFLGIFLTLIILEVGLRIGGFVFLAIQSYENRITYKTEDVYRILALGESTTANLLNGQSSWPEELEIILNNKSKDIKFRVFNEGIPGKTTSNILANLNDNLDKYNPDMVITMMGTNDRGTYVPYEDTLEEKFRLLFKDFRVYKLFKFIIESLENKVEKSKEGTRDKSDRYTVEDKHKIIDQENEELKNLLKDKYGNITLYNETEEKLKRAVEENPENATALIELVNFYSANEKYNEEADVLEKWIGIGPNDPIPYVTLGNIYGNYLNKTEKGIEMYLTYLSITRAYDAFVFGYLAKFYIQVNDYPTAEKFLKLILVLSSNDLERFSDGYKTIAKMMVYYFNNNKSNEAEEMFNFLLKINPRHLIKTYEAMATQYEIIDKPKKIEEMRNKATELRKTYYNPITRQNYLKLYRLLSERGIKLIVMQYPTLDVDELKKMFKGDEEIIFVSNEENFKKVLVSSPYEEYFIDRVLQESKTFGHATKKGNQLIADNLAQVILDVTKINQ